MAKEPKNSVCIPCATTLPGKKHTATCRAAPGMSLFILTTVLTGLLFGCTTEKQVAPRKKLPNILFVVMDTLRADHLGCYGYSPSPSPRIDAFTEKATLYTRAIASAPWTVPAHASFFTGKYAFEHGAHAFKSETLDVNNINPLPDDQLTIAEALKSAGYKTGAFTANWAFMAKWVKLDQGFDEYIIYPKNARMLNRKIFKWLDQNADQNFFLFINYMDTHGLYNIESRSTIIRWYDYALIKLRSFFGKVINRVMKKKEHYLHPRQKMYSEIYSRVMPGIGPIPTDLLEQAVREYDTAIGNLDFQIGALIDRLEQMGLYDDTLIVLISDHGEYFGEHYYVNHGKDVYQEVLWVPMIIKNPFQKDGKVVDQLVSFTDIPKMIVSQLPPDTAAQYIEQFSDAPGNHEVISEMYYALPKDLFNPVWGKRFNRTRTALFDWPYKYIYSTDGRHELYHIEDDPKESINMIHKQPVIAGRLAKRLDEFIMRRGKTTIKTKKTALTEEERTGLRSLGYID